MDTILNLYVVKQSIEKAFRPCRISISLDDKRSNFNKKLFLFSWLLNKRSNYICSHSYVTMCQNFTIYLIQFLTLLLTLGQKILQFLQKLSFIYETKVNNGTIISG